jgi:cell wall-associated NlpC family hydrolase
MRQASRRPLCLLLTALVLSTAAQLASAQEANFSTPTRPRIVQAPINLPLVNIGRIVSLKLPTLSANLFRPPLTFGFVSQPAAILESAILNKIGIPYRFYGTDDRGYDCSGFVWRVFQEAGANFTRQPARDLWQLLPSATFEESREFGTLVFFNDLGHVGIVRDANSFYHSSRSQGIVLSFFAGYWEKRITGFRRAPLNLLPQAPGGMQISRAMGPDPSQIRTR